MIKIREKLMKTVSRNAGIMSASDKRNKPTGRQKDADAYITATHIHRDRQTHACRHTQTADAQRHT